MGAYDFVDAADQLTPLEDLLNRFPAGVQFGEATAVISAQSTRESTSVTFPTPFPVGVVPVVVLTVRTDQPDQRLATVMSRSNTGFDIWAWNNVNTSDLPVQWIAIGF